MSLCNLRNLWMGLFLLRAGGAKARPVLEPSGEFFVTHRWRRAPLAGIPPPHDKFVSRNVLDDLGNGFAVVLFGIFNLAANLSRSLPFPNHRRSGGRQMPIGRARWHVQPGDVLFLVTSGAFLTVQTLAIRTSLHVLSVNVIVIALSRVVAGGMAIQTTRMFEDGNNRSEKLAGFRVVFLE